VKSQPIDPKYDEVRQLAIRVQEQWIEWNETGDGHRKKVWGKDLIDLYGQLLKKMKEVAKSEEEFEHIGALFGVPIVENCYRLALIHAHRLEIPQAIEHLERCVQLDPTNYTHYMKYGELQHNARMYNSAVTAYTHVVNTMTSEFKKPTERPTDVPRPAAYDSPLFNVIEYQPHKKYPHSKLAEVLFRRAISQLALYNNELALEDWKTIIGFEPNHRTAESWAWLSHLARLRGKWQQCVELSTKALEFDPELLLAYYERSVANFVLRNEADMKRDNRNYAILAHERMWGLTNHPIQSDWAAESAPEGDEEE
jgi:tetratricopeptide (TPR) repeat protein